jgi:hypothetical protein
MENGDVERDEEKCHARAEFRRIAVELGLLEAGKPMDAALLEYGFRVAELCAVIGDSYAVVDQGSPGDHIRTRYVLWKPYRGSSKSA